MLRRKFESGEYDRDLQNKRDAISDGILCSNKSLTMLKKSIEELKHALRKDC